MRRRPGLLLGWISANLVAGLATALSQHFLPGWGLLDGPVLLGLAQGLALRSAIGGRWRWWAGLTALAIFLAVPFGLVLGYLVIGADSVVYAPFGSLLPQASPNLFLVFVLPIFGFCWWLPVGVVQWVTIRDLRHSAYWVLPVAAAGAAAAPALVDLAIGTPFSSEVMEGLAAGAAIGLITLFPLLHTRPD
jgi:hypothetical protein